MKIEKNLGILKGARRVADPKKARVTTTIFKQAKESMEGDVFLG